MSMSQRLQSLEHLDRLPIKYPPSFRRSPKQVCKFYPASLLEKIWVLHCGACALLHVYALSQPMSCLDPRRDVMGKKRMLCRANYPLVSTGQGSERLRQKAPWLATCLLVAMAHCTGSDILVQFHPESGETVQPRACAKQNGVPLGRAATSLV